MNASDITTAIRRLVNAEVAVSDAHTKAMRTNKPQDCENLTAQINFRDRVAVELEKAFAALLKGLEEK